MIAITFAWIRANEAARALYGLQIASNAFVVFCKFSPRSYATLNGTTRRTGLFLCLRWLLPRRHIAVRLSGWLYAVLASVCLCVSWSFSLHNSAKYVHIFAKLNYYNHAHGNQSRINHSGERVGGLTNVRRDPFLIHVAGFSLGVHFSSLKSWRPFFSRRYV